MPQRWRQNGLLLVALKLLKVSLLLLLLLFLLLLPVQPLQAKHPDGPTRGCPCMNPQASGERQRGTACRPRQYRVVHAQPWRDRAQRDWPWQDHAKPQRGGSEGTREEASTTRRPCPWPRGSAPQQRLRGFGRLARRCPCGSTGHERGRGVLSDHHSGPLLRTERRAMFCDHRRWCWRCRYRCRRPIHQQHSPPPLTRPN
jgi:hypothetical protein